MSNYEKPKVEFHKPLVTIELAEYNSMLKLIKTLEENPSNVFKEVLDEFVHYTYNHNKGNYIGGNFGFETPQEFLDKLLKKHNLGTQMDRNYKVETFINNIKTNPNYANF